MYRYTPQFTYRPQITFLLSCRSSLWGRLLSKSNLAATLQEKHRLLLGGKMQKPRYVPLCNPTCSCTCYSLSFLSAGCCVCDVILTIRLQT